MSTWDLSLTRQHVLICNGGSCLRNGADMITQVMREEIGRLGLDDLIHTTRTRCNGRCEDACVAIVYPEGVWYKHLDEEKAREVVHQHLVQGDIPIELVSHVYRNEVFQRMPNTATGVKKQK